MAQSQSKSTIYCRLTFALALTLTLAGFVPLTAQAMPIKTQMMKPRAYFQEADNNLLQALDLKAKTLRFTNKDAELCGTNLVRQAQTLTYSCSLKIPSRAKVSKLQNLVTARTVDVQFGGTNRVVEVSVSSDAKQVTFTTAFDATGIDFEVSKFNDDFFKVYDKVAQLVIAEAQKRQSVRIEVLESL